MSALGSLSVVSGRQMPLKIRGGGNEIIGKGESRSLAGERAGEVPQLIVGFPAGSAVLFRGLGR